MKHTQGADNSSLFKIEQEFCLKREKERNSVMARSLKVKSYKALGVRYCSVRCHSGVSDK